MHSFLFELGAEELPDNVILPAGEFLLDSFRKIILENGLCSQDIKLFTSPRRLTILCSGLPEKQEDQKIEKIGPAKSIAYTANGSLSPAGNGFLKKTGASLEDAFIQVTEKGDFLAVCFVQKGRSSKEILHDWMLTIVEQIPLPKKMIWDTQSFGFSRPIRWLVALWDTEVISVTIHGLSADRYSCGNRYLGLDAKIEISHADDYEATLSSGEVLVCRETRKNTICKQMNALFADGTFYVGKDERLLDTVTNLVESPNAVIGVFDAKFLVLPDKIITSTISQNQKYFSVYDDGGKLVNKFVFISNGDPMYADVIKSGNEKVVRARLEDAMWFFQEDTKHHIESYLPHLSEVVFQANLGTLADKCKRIAGLVGWISEALQLGEQETLFAQRTAMLCKADLVTQMLGEKEFTKLQGYIGKQYALISGEEPQVAEGIYEHYMPRGSNDSLPQTLWGAICAVADKLDTVVGIIGVGLMPTGSADPYALRRAASGIVQIVAERKWNFRLFDLIDYAISQIEGQTEIVKEAMPNIHSFFTQRIAWLLKELGMSHDVVASVMHIELSSLNDLIERARALQALKADEQFTRLVIGFKRVSNIIGSTKSFSVLNKNLLESGSENNLYIGLSGLREEIDEALVELNYRLALERLIGFGILIDLYFDDVLVNCEDMVLRENRYALLNEIRKEFLRVANISLIVVDNE